MLRGYLRYAESGGADLGERTRDRDPLNPFEADVYNHLSAAGLALECQVGCSGYWIDFAAKHPTQPGRYVLAIEADGVMYHSSATARDRDRLRQDHLQRLGWRFHRIWSSEWFRHREKEVARALAAYEEALRTRVPEHSSAEPAAPPFVAGAYADEEDESVRSDPRPFWPDGRAITEYRTRDLVRFIRWLESDGKLRIQEDLITLAIKELGYERSSAPRREVLARVIAAARQ